MKRDELQRNMLENINKEYDRSEGSFFFDAIAPVAIELEKSYAEQNRIMSNTFADSATGEFLERKCNEMGLYRRPAAKAIGEVEITGAVGLAIQKGILVASELVTFATVESVTISVSGKVTVGIECIQTGIVGNVPIGAVKYFPVTIDGLSAVINSAAVTSGCEVETDKSLRQRFFEKINSPATSGNVGHYKQWAKSVVGVGDARVVPTWNGPGTVRVVICSANKRVADAKLINSTAAYIETQRPVGASVSVISAIEKQINVSATITLENGKSVEQVKAGFGAELSKYFEEIAFSGQYVSFAKIGSILYDMNGVTDYLDLTVNSGSINIPCSAEEIPALGTVVFR